MKTVEEIMKYWEDGQTRIQELHPFSPAAQNPIKLNENAVRASLRIWEILKNRPDDMAHPKNWDERTILTLTGAIMARMDEDFKKSQRNPL